MKVCYSKLVMGNPIKIKAFVDKIISHDEKVYTIIFRSADRFPRFKPGQFLHLTIDEFDPTSGFWPESRVFSIASAPGKENISIVYSVKGQYTQKMENYLSPGASVWLKLPYGDFIIDSQIEKDQDVILIAGGTGISPFIPYLEAQLESGNFNKSISLYYGIRKKYHLLIPNLLEKCLQKLNQFKFVLFCENYDLESGEFGYMNQQSGIIRIEDIVKQSRNLNNPVFFISGPPVMIGRFKQFLSDNGIAKGCIKSDEWE